VPVVREKTETPLDKQRADALVAFGRKGPEERARVLEILWRRAIESAAKMEARAKLDTSV
jgi:hypothetical protein